MPINVVVAVIDACNSRLLEAREAAVQPGTSVCVTAAAPPVVPTGSNQTDANGPRLVIGIAVRNGIFQHGAQGVIINSAGLWGRVDCCFAPIAVFYCSQCTRPGYIFHSSV